MTDNTESKKYRLITGVWETTMNCNMRCKHCGSSCEAPRPDELTTEEALQLCDALGRLGMRRITLSGGEPFTRKDWPQIAQRLTDNGIKANILSNGWFIDRESIRIAKTSGLANIGMSMDGLEDTHDYIRKKGSFARIMNSLGLLKEEKMSAGIVTCVHHKNISQLEGMKKILIAKGVRAWQLQAAVPMGNMLENAEWILEPAMIDRIIDFAHDAMNEGKINVYLGDNIGYFNLNEIEVRKNSINSEFYSGIWNGCPAGKRSLGIRSNGDIIGCNYIRDDSLIEANVRQIPLETIWSRPGAFAWNRDISKEKLSGFCKICQYGDYCLGGCAGTKQLRFHSLGENPFCSYHHAVQEEKKSICLLDDLKELSSKGRKAAKEEEFQLAQLLIARALELAPDNIGLLTLQGYIHFNLENLQECETLNRKALDIAPESAYALKGLGICLSHTGRVDEGIALLKQSIQHADENFTEPYFDLAVVLNKNNRNREALEVLEQGRRNSQIFVDSSEPFYRKLKKITR
ncbi:MAG: radical SAM protein [bacterium]|nr:radical SAM protein [bacterium]